MKKYVIETTVAVESHTDYCDLTWKVAYDNSYAYTSETPTIDEIREIAYDDTKDMLADALENTKTNLNPLDIYLIKQTVTEVLNEQTSIEW